jgi:hypothetical protein
MSSGNKEGINLKFFELFKKRTALFLKNGKNISMSYGLKEDLFT